MKHYMLLAAVLAVTAVPMMAMSPAGAATHTDDEGGGGTYVPPFAQPLDALGGDTLAQHIADHQASRIHVVV